MNKLTKICMLVVLFFASSNALADMVDFEGIPDTYLFFGGGVNLGGYYPGLNFGPDATILDKVRYGYNSTGYPPHSGDAVLGSVSNQTIRVDFDIASTYVGAWYTSGSTFYLEAYDASDNLLDSAAGSPNLGTNSLISVSGGNIAYVLFHDYGAMYSIDDLEFTPVPVPGAVLLGLLGLSVAGVKLRKHA